MINDTPLPVSDARTGGRFAVLPSRAAADTRLRPIDILVLSILTQTESEDGVKRRDGWFMIHQQTVAALAGLDRSTVNKSIRRIREAGYIVQQRQNSAAGSEIASVYRLVYDADLPPRFDRWALVADPHGVIDLDCDDFLTPSSSLERDAARPAEPANGPVETSESCGVTDRHTPPPTMENQGVTTDHTPVPLHHTGVTLEHAGMRIGTLLPVPPGHSAPSNSRSIDKDSRVEQEQDLTERLVKLFLDLRATYYPDERSRPSSTAKLREQAARYVELAGPDRMNVVSATLQRRIAASPEQGLDAPAAIDRYRKDILRDLGEEPVARVAIRRPDVERPVVSVEQRERWTTALAEIAVSQPTASSFLTSAVFLGMDGDTARIAVRSKLIARGIEEKFSDALAAALGMAVSVEVAPDLVMRLKEGQDR